MKNENTATIRRLATTAGAGLAAIALLAACTTEEGSDSVSQPPIDTPSASATDAGAEETTGSTETDGEATDTASDDAGDDAGAQGDDPVFGVIDAVLSEYADGIIVDVDRDDRRDHYDVDVVVGNEIIELEVTFDGEIREDDREGDDDDDVREAQQATVTVAEAIQEALNQQEGSVLDEAQLDDDDDRLVWEIDLDDEDGRDLAELTIPAN